MEKENKLITLRQAFDVSGITAYIIPQTDVHQNEYVPATFRRLEWLTNFSGSAGLAIVARKSAAVFVDGRYTLQVRAQVDMDAFEARKLAFADIEKWLQENLQEGDTLGFDPWLLTETEFRKYQEISNKLKINLKAVRENLIDSIWDNRPSVPSTEAFIRSEKWAGLSAVAKIQLICKQIKESKTDAALLTQLDSVAWLLNLRGNDIPCVPVVLSFAIVNRDETVDLFIDITKVTDEVRSHYQDVVRFYPYQALEEKLVEIAKNHKTILIDPLRAPYKTIEAVENAGGKVVRLDDVCLMPRACKNEAEIKGAREAHIKDGIAMIHLLSWLTSTIKDSTVMELEVSARLRSFRQEQGALDDSFTSITGSGPNGAIVHYNATPQSNRALGMDEIFLLDSGGQYCEGTTDVTRTMIFGTPTAEQKDRFTRVLKGHIQLARARFPHGTSGHQLDCLARYALWQSGLDYAHGTGHGVGSYLNVHEGPQRISPAPNTVALQPGMILSNEPGYYKQGTYGIRIENLVTVRKCASDSGFEQEMLEFETLTLVPIDRHLIDHTMLNAEEKEWLNDYHARVYDTMAGRIQPFAQEWLKAATAAIH